MIFRPLLASAFAAYWFIFWLMNGLDKFLYSTSFGSFAWYGKDRHEQFERYFGNMGLPDISIDGMLAFAGYVEILIALPFLVCAIALLSSNTKIWNKGLCLMHYALTAAFAVFLAFIILDIVAGDRAELLEHSTYLAVLAASYMVAFLEFHIRKMPLASSSIEVEPQMQTADTGALTQPSTS